MTVASCQAVVSHLQVSHLFLESTAGARDVSWQEQSVSQSVCLRVLAEEDPLLRRSAPPSVPLSASLLCFKAVFVGMLKVIFESRIFLMRVIFDFFFEC